MPPSDGSAQTGGSGIGETLHGSPGFGSCKEGLQLITKGLSEVRNAGFLPEELLLGLVESDWARVESDPSFAGSSKTFQQLQLLSELVRVIENFSHPGAAPVPDEEVSSPGVSTAAGESERSSDAFFSPEEDEEGTGSGGSGSSQMMATALQHLPESTAACDEQRLSTGSDQTTSPMHPQRLSFRTSSGASSAPSVAGPSAESPVAEGAEVPLGSEAGSDIVVHVATLKSSAESPAGEDEAGGVGASPFRRAAPRRAAAATPFVDDQAGGVGSSDEDEGDGMDYYEDDGWIVPPGEEEESEGEESEEEAGGGGGGGAVSGDEDSAVTGVHRPEEEDDLGSTPEVVAPRQQRGARAASEGEGGDEDESGKEDEDEDEAVVFSVRRGASRSRVEVIIDSSDDEHERDGAEGEGSDSVVTAAPAHRMSLVEAPSDPVEGRSGEGHGTPGAAGGGGGEDEEEEDLSQFRGRRGARSRRAVVDSDDEGDEDSDDGDASDPLPPRDSLHTAPAPAPSPRKGASPAAAAPPKSTGRHQVVVLSDSDSDEEGGAGKGCIVWSTVKKAPARRRRVEDSPEQLDGPGGDDSDGIFSMEPMRVLADELAGFSISSSSSTPKTPAGPSTPAAFKRQKEDLTQKLYAEYNREIFGGKLPAELEIKWNQTLKTTAGVTHFKRQVAAEGYHHTAWVELSTKVLDSHDRLRRTLCHELCHVAAWLVDHVAKPPHGSVFKKWASRAMAKYPDLDITTCHQYEIFFKFRWRCSNSWCLREYGRHSNSIDPKRQGCGVCGGRLEFLGRFNQDGSSAKAPRPPTAFALFVKEKYAATKANAPAGTSHQEVMKLVSEAWKGQKPLGERN